MRTQSRSRVFAAAAGLGVAALALSACTGDMQPDASDVDCTDYEEYGTFDGAEVTIGGTILDLEADRLVESWSDFSACTGIQIDYQGSSEFEAQIAVLAEGGNAPDIGIVPQPGLLARLAEGGWLIPASEAVEAHVDEFWSEDWKTYGTYDDTFYAAPLMASIKGYIWYSPSEFEENGWEIPATLDDLEALSEQIAADGDHKPWCVGLESGDATGWPGTDWIEDWMLRLHGADVYDQWVTHEIPFNDPQVVEAFDAVGGYLKNEDMVNGGIGDVSTLVTEAFQTAGLPILDGECSLHHQASFYETFWNPEGGDEVTVASNGDIFGFLTPPANAGDPLSVTGGGEFPVAFTDAEEVEAVRAYLSSDTWANNRVSLGGVISANTGVDPENASSELLVQSIEILQDPETTFRFDGSDLMPGAVGADSFWKGIVAWVSGDDTETVVDEIEASWPAS
ncbi:MAG TPA: carbohydrate ABC transporter substrate-binding protein [Microbacterium sp.]|mgnify:FL=1|jgi:alpha-glucoside transport system substrate-binding protein|uniref:ABC transporter substrate-binding protein n=1 Tax=Microbacterium sp. UBA1612 TaxID=1946942 RepID=UPI0008DA47D0|nr:ABC transporter substrate-binding protein [Microbacterium sp. UBA1612]HAS31383.1 carbohydrate ABC transporter substrate-binding protein [Microbacterium sp.]HBR90039.1 carbohydrate ABC transporter substrate-binding protein [Microbacterium sp.]|tara:strand:+ start:3857 stop:5212 length:1356 start_codon:yes stop_codon:yes gene_type:complete